MKVVCVGIAVLALAGIAVLGYAGGPSLKDMNVSQPERDVLSGRVIFQRSASVVMGSMGRERGR